MKRPISVLLVEDHALVRKGFRRILEDDPEIKVVGEAADGADGVKMARELRPDVVVMDMNIPGLNGAQATMEIGKQVPTANVLVVSMYSEESYLRSAFEAGARGYILKNAVDIDLASAVKKVAAGHRVVDAKLIPSARPPEDDLNRLTQRERQILQLIAEGKSNKEIASLLNLSVNTVSVHRQNLMEELGIHRTAELVLYAIRK